MNICHQQKRPCMNIYFELIIKQMYGVRHAVQSNNCQSPRPVDGNKRKVVLCLYQQNYCLPRNQSWSLSSALVRKPTVRQIGVLVGLRDYHAPNYACVLNVIMKITQLSTLMMMTLMMCNAFHAIMHMCIECNNEENVDDI